MYCLVHHDYLQLLGAQNTDMDAGAMGATYGFTKTAAANLREKEDPWNPAIAGFLAGAVGGLKGESAFHRAWEPHGD